MLVRSWNLFNGNTFPPRRRAYLREMIDLVTSDKPDVVCLQEVPGWALGRLGGWSGMTAIPAWAKRPTLGPMPIPAPLGRALTAPHHGVIRSAFAGQGNEILLAPSLTVRARDSRAFVYGRREEPRVAQRVDLDGLVVANVHCSHGERGKAELESILGLLEDADVLVLAGDFNTTPEQSPAIAGFAGALPGSIDQVLVRGATASARAWPDEDRRYGGRLLSDHAPVETTIQL
jgi:endonuclease/exonuclease/phosphatase family metal-dependent hydrolase